VALVAFTAETAARAAEEMMTFREWFDQSDWWKVNSASDRLSPVWSELERRGMSGEEIAETLDTVIGVIRDEYGE
jgi:hypothetical protein